MQQPLWRRIVSHTIPPAAWTLDVMTAIQACILDPKAESTNEKLSNKKIEGLSASAPWWHHPSSLLHTFCLCSHKEHFILLKLLLFWVSLNYNRHHWPPLTLSHNTAESSFLWWQSIRSYGVHTLKCSMLYLRTYIQFSFWTEKVLIKDKLLLPSLNPMEKTLLYTTAHISSGNRIHFDRILGKELNVVTSQVVQRYTELQIHKHRGTSN